MKGKFKALRALKVLSLKGSAQLIAGIVSNGVNLMLLLKYTAKLYPKSIAIVGESGSYTYQELYDRTINAALFLHNEHKLSKEQKVALMCGNSIDLIVYLFALSRLGVQTYILSTEMKEEQLDRVINKCKIDIIIFDHNVPEIIGMRPDLDHLEISCEHHDYGKRPRLRKANFSKFSLLSGGTTGGPKSTTHKASLHNFLSPLHELLTTVKIQQYNSVFIPVPLYHGFGLSSFFVSMVLGKTVYLMNKFNVKEAAEFIEKHEIEVITSVPLLIRRLIDYEPEKLKSVKCIITGGAELKENLYHNVVKALGDIIFNLYGTSETGFCLLASPEELSDYPDTIGKPIMGVKIGLFDEDRQLIEDDSVGRICVKNQWSAINDEKWIETGDLAYRNPLGYYFLCGRVDDMIVSGGQNVYPIELENILLKHVEIEEVAVIGIADEEFGQRLKAFIKIKERSKLNEEEIIVWLKQNAERYLIPKAIQLVNEMPYTTVGKPNKKVLI